MPSHDHNISVTQKASVQKSTLATPRLTYSTLSPRACYELAVEQGRPRLDRKERRAYAQVPDWDCRATTAKYVLTRSVFHKLRHRRRCKFGKPEVENLQLISRRIDERDAHAYPWMNVNDLSLRHEASGPADDVHIAQTSDWKRVEDIHVTSLPAYFRNSSGKTHSLSVRHFCRSGEGIAGRFSQLCVGRVRPTRRSDQPYGVLKFVRRAGRRHAQHRAQFVAR